MDNQSFPDPANKETNPSAGNDADQQMNPEGKWQEMPGERKNNDQPPPKISPDDDKEMHIMSEEEGSAEEKEPGDSGKFSEMKGERMNNDQEPS